MEPYLEYDERNHIVRSVFRGPLNPETVREYGKKVLELGKQHATRRLLTDIRAAEWGMTVSDLYTVLWAMSEQGIDRNWKRAIVVQESLTVEGEFYEQIAQQRLYSIRVFKDPDEALTWLTDVATDSLAG